MDWSPPPVRIDPPKLRGLDRPTATPRTDEPSTDNAGGDGGERQREPTRWVEPQWSVELRARLAKVERTPVATAGSTNVGPYPFRPPSVLLGKATDVDYQFAAPTDRTDPARASTEGLRRAAAIAKAWMDSVKPADLSTADERPYVLEQEHFYANQMGLALEGAPLEVQVASVDDASKDEVKVIREAVALSAGSVRTYARTREERKEARANLQRKPAR